jgi:23S rRNA (uracil1939-C5)-methyltransferase
VSVWTKRDAASAPRLVAGTPAVLENWGDVPIQLRGDAFLQINRAVAGLLDAWVLELCGNVAGKRVLDAYCGIGLLSHRLTAAGAHATGIERAAEAVREAAALTPAARFLVGPVERLIQSALPADIVILNPPRTGVDETVCTALRDQPPARLLYISCDPATLARDVARLGDRFAPVSLRCFDMFPQTAHIETVLAMQCATS